MPLRCGAPKANTRAVPCSGLPLPALSSADPSREAPQPLYRASSPAGFAMPPKTHPVLAWLSRWHDRGMASPAEQAVLRHGRSFTGIARPKGYRLRAIKNCFANAGDLACADRGTYVEGFAIAPSVGPPVHHAWITLDGINAVEVTWRAPASECQYFGIPFPAGVLRRFTLQTKSWGPLLEGPELKQVLRDAGLHL
jgi:hypothetical protein